MADTYVSVDSCYATAFLCYCTLVQLLLRLLPKGEELKTRIHGKIAIKATRSASLKDTGYKGERAPKSMRNLGRLQGLPRRWGTWKMGKAGSGASR